MKWCVAAKIFVLGLLATSDVSAADFDLPRNLDATQLRRVVVQHTGRLQPLDTLARDLVWKVTGTEYFAGADQVITLLDWTFRPEAWRDAAIIPVGNAALRAALELPTDRSRFSLSELAAHEPLTRRMTELRRGGNRSGDPLASKVAGISERLEILANVLMGQAIRCIPHPRDALGAWGTVAMLQGGEAPEYDAVSTHWNALAAAYRSGDAAAFATSANALSTQLASLPTISRLTEAKIDLELSHNKLHPFTRAWQALWVGVVLALISSIYASRMKHAAGILDLLVMLAFLAGFWLSSLGLWQRGVIAGRLPAANMFESLLFLSWGAALAAVVSSAIVAFAHTWRPLLLTSGIMGALTLMLADLLPLDQFLRPIAPVLLDTVWMALHVPVIMVSYAVLTIAVAIAHAQLAVLALFPRATKLANRLDRMHYLYAFVGALLLIVGIITGSMWGAASWGRYWGWDPKEVWSLIAFLGYMVILHVRVDRQPVPVASRVIAGLLGVGVLILIAQPLAPLSGVEFGALTAAGATGLIFLLTNGAFATAVKSILAFWLIVMTYVGVNYVLGTGLHSYGFGAGPVVLWMYRLGSIDLAFVLLMTVLYLVRSQPSSASADPTATGQASAEPSVR